MHEHHAWSHASMRAWLPDHHRLRDARDAWHAAPAKEEIVKLKRRSMPGIVERSYRSISNSPILLMQSMAFILFQWRKRNTGRLSMHARRRAAASPARLLRSAAVAGADKNQPKKFLCERDQYIRMCSDGSACMSIISQLPPRDPSRLLVCNCIRRLLYIY